MNMLAIVAVNNPRKPMPKSKYTQSMKTSRVIAALSPVHKHVQVWMMTHNLSSFYSVWLCGAIALLFFGCGGALSEKGLGIEKHPMSDEEFVELINSGVIV